MTEVKYIRPVEIVTIDAPEHDATSTPTVVGANPWSDDDDLTYVHFANTGTFVGPGMRPTETRQDTVRATFEPADITGLEYVRLHVRGYGTTPDTFRSEIDARYQFRDNTGAAAVYVAGSISESTTPVNWSWPIIPEDFPSTGVVVTVPESFTFADFETELNAGITMDVWFDLFTWQGEQMRLHEVSLEIGYTETVDPILRVYPRSDGRGLSSARRVWPPNKVSQDKRWLPYGGGYR